MKFTSMNFGISIFMISLLNLASFRNNFIDYYFLRESYKNNGSTIYSDEVRKRLSSLKWIFSNDFSNDHFYIKKRTPVRHVFPVCIEYAKYNNTLKLESLCFCVTDNLSYLNPLDFSYYFRIVILWLSY